MATVITDTIRDELKSNGVWGDFVRRRDEAKVSDGICTNDASRKVLSEMASEGLVSDSTVESTRKKRRGRPKKVVRVESEACSNGGSSKSSCAGTSNGLDDPYCVDESVFAGRSCPKSVAYEWAFSHQVVRDVKPNDAPSLYAWSLYAFFKRSVSAMVDISKQCLSVTIRKESETFDSGERFDGEGIYDLLKAIETGGGG